MRTLVPHSLATPPVSAAPRSGCNGQAGPLKAIIGDDQKRDHSLTDLPYCTSILDIPIPFVNLSLCRVSV